MSYTVIIKKGTKSYGAYVPDLPGCIAAARSRAQVELLIREAIAMHVEDLRASGQPVPRPRSQAIAIAA